MRNLRQIKAKWVDRYLPALLKLPGFFRHLRLRIDQLERSERKFVYLQREIQKCRAVQKQQRGGRIHVVFVCHMPGAWGKLRPVYSALKSDPAFDVTVVAVPYRHPSAARNDYKDGGMSNYLRTDEGIEAVRGYDEAKGEWLDLQDLAPDYVFFQTPYDPFPYKLTSDCVSCFARVCYVPYYGVLIYEGEVENITHPRGFFRNTSLVFVAHENERIELLKRFSEMEASNVVTVGCPTFERIQELQTVSGRAWNLPRSPAISRILWTPRWRTSEGNCHFFDYKDYFIELARSNQDVDFLFRPHPLCLKNFAATGEFSEAEQNLMVKEYASLANAGIDTSGDYHDLFLSSDILVSDMSSMIAEYFLTGKPIVYTHRTDAFNDFGRELSSGLYWARNKAELDGVLRSLRRGDDPLKERRQELIEKLYVRPTGGSSELIKTILKDRFREEAVANPPPA